MKILLVANADWYLYNFRFSLAEFLRAEGHHIVCVSAGGEFARFLNEGQSRWVEWRVGRQTLAPWKELAAIFALARIYRREAPDLVHHHTIKAVAYGTLAARLARVKVVVNSIVGLGYVFTNNSLKARLLRPIVLFFFRLAGKTQGTRWIFENQQDFDWLVEKGVVRREAGSLIEGAGVDMEKYRPSPEPDGAPVVLYAGRMLLDKGIGVLAEAARLVREQTQARFVLVGQPDPGNPASVTEQMLNDWTAAGLVEWMGFQSSMDKYYALANMVALPSMYGEGVPTFLLEAAASGRAIVASDIPGCRSVVKDGYNGFLVPPNDAPKLAEALLKLIRDPGLRNRMGKAGREFVAGRFSHQDVNAATLAVYETLANTVTELHGSHDRSA